jgi:hypothetical protein
VEAVGVADIGYMFATKMTVAAEEVRREEMPLWPDHSYVTRWVTQIAKSRKTRIGFLSYAFDFVGTVARARTGDLLFHRQAL